MGRRTSNFIGWLCSRSAIELSCMALAMEREQTTSYHEQIATDGGRGCVAAPDSLKSKKIF